MGTRLGYSEVARETGSNFSSIKEGPQCNSTPNRPSLLPNLELTRLFVTCLVYVISLLQGTIMYKVDFTSVLIIYFPGKKWLLGMYYCILLSTLKASVSCVFFPRLRPRSHESEHFWNRIFCYPDSSVRGPRTLCSKKMRFRSADSLVSWERKVNIVCGKTRTLLVALSLACLEIRYEMRRRLDRERSSFFPQSQARRAKK